MNVRKFTLLVLHSTLLTKQPTPVIADVLKLPVFITLPEQN